MKTDAGTDPRRAVPHVSLTSCIVPPQRAAQERALCMCFSTEYFRRRLTQRRQRQTADGLLLLPPPPPPSVPPAPPLFSQASPTISLAVFIFTVSWLCSSPSSVPYHCLPLNTARCLFLFSPSCFVCVFSHLSVLSSHSFTPCLVTCVLASPSSSQR